MYYGFDIGGSKIALGAYDARRQLQWQTRVPTPRDDYAALLQVLCDLTAQADRRFGCRGSVGVGVPGLPVPDDGTLFTANIPAAQGQRLQADLSARLGREVRIDNDANCFALSEAWDDAFRHYPVVLGLILGTGVGGGVVVNGRPLTGRNHIAGELGHVRLPVDALAAVGEGTPLRRCGCGQLGCVETWLSGEGFAWLFQQQTGEALSAPAIVARFQRGDAQARQHLARYRALLAVCLGHFLTLFDPHLVVLGGGLSQCAALYEGLGERVRPHLLPAARLPRFEPARHGDAGGMRGAAFLHLNT
ncbi:N-acetylglucosamine kinase [Pantoea sp. 1.19]|uniref:N-acetylglucosamine kinase n=1 Tax=Pantoea sp. 1.19 TaxID=1925589 RepID=UPI0009489EB6|nr:N-acetylglucosamine kinase [Pantoea sp. 1.19]